MKRQSPETCHHNFRLVDRYSEAKRLYHAEPDFAGWMLKCTLCSFWYVEEDLQIVEAEVAQ